MSLTEEELTNLTADFAAHDYYDRRETVLAVIAELRLRRVEVEVMHRQIAALVSEREALLDRIVRLDRLPG